jgi:hypothetical protein
MTRDRRLAREAAMQLVKLSILGVMAGFFAVLIFHPSLWYLLNLVGLIPLDRPAWPLDPIPPYGVPSVISKAFWGGARGALLAPLLQGLTGRAYWAGWIIIGAVALSLVAFLVVPPIKGEPIPALWPRFRGPSRQRRDRGLPCPASVWVPQWPQVPLVRCRNPESVAARGDARREGVDRNDVTIVI